MTNVYYAARPDALALPAHRSQVPGIHEHVNADGIHELSYIYPGSNGVLMEQDLVPVPADWAALKQTLLALPAAEHLRIDARGLIEFTIDGLVVKARVDYRVEQGESCNAANQALLCFAEYRDINSDGVGDYLLVYPNGDRQWLFIYP